MDNIDDVVVFSYGIDPPCGINYINFPIVHWTFYKPEAFYEDPELFWKVIHPEDLPKVKAMFTGQEAFQIPFRIIRSDGKIFYVQARCSGYHTSWEKMVGVRGTLRLLVDNQPLPTAHETTAQSLNTLIHKSESGMAIMANGSGQIMDANIQFVENMGEKERLVGSSLIDFVEWFRPEDKILLKQDESGRVNYRGMKIRLRTQVGKSLELDFSAVTYPFEGQECVLVTMNEYLIQQEIQRFVSELAIVSDIGRTLAEDLNLPAIYDRLAKNILRLFPDTTTLFISRYHPEIHQITCAYARINNESMDVALFDPVPLEERGKGVQSEAIHQRQPVIINDFAQKSRVVTKMILIGTDSDPGPVPRAALCAPMMSQNNVLGVVQVQSLMPNRYNSSDATMLSVVANTAAIVLQNAELVDHLNQSNLDLIAAYDKTLEGWVHALDLRDHETEGHSKRVSAMTAELAIEFGLSAEQIVHLKRGALLHDLGKMGVPDNILHKPGKLDPEEWKIMRMHTIYARDMIQAISYLKKAVDIPYCHHEKWDGTGYPQGLKGEDIPFGARLFSVVDVYDALLSDRDYRAAMKMEVVLEYIRANSGSHFDPQVAKVFLAMLARKEKGESDQALVEGLCELP